MLPRPVRLHAVAQNITGRTCCVVLMAMAECNFVFARTAIQPRQVWSVALRIIGAFASVLTGTSVCCWATHYRVRSCVFL